MERIDKIVYGDNQFFGINHRSQDKAEQLAERFSDINEIFRTYNVAYDCGVRAIMLNSNDKAAAITEYFRQHKSKFQDVNWYPSIPYPHKYANMVAEKGIFGTFNEVVMKNQGALGALKMIGGGAMAAMGKDGIKMLQLLVDAELAMFKGLNLKVVFLQNVITDLLLGYQVKEVFQGYCDHIRKKYNAIPGIITVNMPYLVSKLKEWGIEEVVVCSSINKIGFTMNPSLDSYLDVLKNNDPNKYQMMAMSTLASGAIPPKEAFEFINGLNIQSVVFGASSEKNIRSSMEMIRI